MKPRSVMPFVCAATLLQAGCGGNGSEETILVPQLRLGAPGEQTLSLAATERIERRNDVGVPELESASLQREVWVLSRVGDPPACEKLGNATPSSDGSSTDEFVLQVDTPPGAAVNPALTLLDALPVAADVSLFVFWSVPNPSARTEDDRLLLDAAEYDLIKGLPSSSGGEETGDGADPEPKNLIYLVEPDGPAAVDGMVLPVAEETDPSTCTGPDLTRDPDGDGVDTLDELNAGIPLDETVAGSARLADGALVGNLVDVIVVADGGETPVVPLGRTWRVYKPPMSETDPMSGGVLELPQVQPPVPERGEGDALELRLATTGGGTLLLEAAFPVGFDAGGGTLSVMAGYAPDGGGPVDPMPFACPPDTTVPDDLPDMPMRDVALGSVYDGGGGDDARLTIRCEAGTTVPSGRYVLPEVRVSLTPGAADEEPAPVERVWELRALEVFLHEPVSAGVDPPTNPP